MVRICTENNGWRSRRGNKWRRFPTDFSTSVFSLLCRTAWDVQSEHVKIRFIFPQHPSRHSPKQRQLNTKTGNNPSCTQFNLQAKQVENWDRSAVSGNIISCRPSPVLLRRVIKVTQNWDHSVVSENIISCKPSPVLLRREIQVTQKNGTAQLCQEISGKVVSRMGMENLLYTICQFQQL